MSFFVIFYINKRDPVAVLAHLERRIVWTEVVQMWDLGIMPAGTSIHV